MMEDNDDEQQQPPPDPSKGAQGYKKYLFSSEQEQDIPLSTYYKKRRKTGLSKDASQEAPTASAPADRAPGPSTFTSPSEDHHEDDVMDQSEFTVGAYLDDDDSSLEDSDNYDYPSEDSDSDDDVEDSSGPTASAIPIHVEPDIPATDEPEPTTSTPGDKPYDPNLDNKLSGCEFTRFEMLLMVLTLSLRFCLSNIAISELCKLLNLILGRCFLPTTSKAFWNVFRSDVSVCIHFYCPKCMLYLGKKENCSQKNCSTCGHPLNTSKMNNGHFFITVPIGEQVKKLLERPDGMKLINFKKNRVVNNDIISDIFDGSLFHDLDGKVNLTEYDLTLIINTDGSPVFHSGRSSIWPILYRINEMEPKERYAPWSTLMTGLWFGKKKISMSTYLTPLVSELKELGKNGIKWVNPMTKSIETTRIFVLNTCLDTIAKAPVMNMKQFNGEYGCPYCYHPGNSLPEMNNQIRYSHNKSVEERTDESVRNDMREAQRKGTVEKGMFGPSPLMYLPSFNCCHGFAIDYLHAYLLGVTKYLFCTLWTSQKNKPYYLDSETVAEMDKQLLNFTPPSHISRDPRTLVQASDWKGNEWRMWLLYYGPICLWGKLSMRYYKNFCRLSSVIYKLLQKSLPKSELPWVRSEMEKFNEEFQDLYELPFMTWNVHSTMHLEKNIRMSGPLWATSLFPFESGNGFLLDLVTGSKGVPLQVTRKYGASISLPDIIEEHPKLHDDVVEFYDRMMSHYQPRLKTATSFDGVTVVGNPFNKIFRPTVEENILFTNKGIPVNNLFWLKRVIYNGYSFSSAVTLTQTDPSAESKTKKKDDSFVRLNSGVFAGIRALVISSRVSPCKVYALLNPINMINNTCIVPHIKSCGVYLFDKQKTLLVPVTAIQKKCILLKRSNNEKFITECFYNLDRD